MKADEEISEDTKRLLNGEEINGESVNRVDDVPTQFKDWLNDNAKRSETTYSKPYFVTDNEKYIPQRLLEAYGSKLPYPTYAEYEQAMQYNRKHGGFSAEQLQNIKELNAVLPVIQGQVMPFGAANLKPFKAVGLADTNSAKRLFIEGHTATKGRYEVYCQWKGGWKLPYLSRGILNVRVRPVRMCGPP